MTSTSEPRLSDITSAAADAAARLRAQRRPIPVVGHKEVTRQVERKGFLGRTETVPETVRVPIELPGWPIGLNRVVLRATSETIDEVVLTPEGKVVTLRVDRDKPEESRVASSHARYALRVAQSVGGTPEWVQTGNGTDSAARHQRAITAGEAVRHLLDLLSRMG